MTFKICCRVDFPTHVGPKMCACVKTFSVHKHNVKTVFSHLQAYAEGPVLNFLESSSKLKYPADVHY